MKTTYRPALAKPQVRMLAHDSSVSMTVENRLLSQFSKESETLSFHKAGFSPTQMGDIE